MIDLSQLSIPPVSVVPEPTAGEIKTAITEADLRPRLFYDKVICHLARRCRDLEAEVEWLKGLLISEWPGGGYIVTAVHFVEPPAGGEKSVDSNGRVLWWFETKAGAWAAVRKAACK